LDWVRGDIFDCMYTRVPHIPVPTPCPNCYRANDTFMNDWLVFLNDVTKKPLPDYLKNYSWYIKGNTAGSAYDFKSFSSSSLYGKQGRGDSANLKWKITEYKMPKMAMKIYDGSGYLLNATLSFPNDNAAWNFGEILSFTNLRLAPNVGCEPNTRYLVDAIYKRPNKYWSEKTYCPNYQDVFGTDFCYDTVTMIGELSSGLVSQVPCLGCAKLCNIPYAPIKIDPEPCATVDKETAFANALIRYDAYLNERMIWFDSAYTKRCMATPERFNVQYKSKQQHYTLYYYDRAGQLIKTVPPEGVDIGNNSIAAIDRQNLANLRIAMAAEYRANNSLPKAQTYHHLITQYQYNSMGALYVTQSPDAGTSALYYDALGRVLVSQDQRDLNTDAYRYTVYDALGRPQEGGITKNNAAPVLPMEEKTYNQAAFSSWLATGNHFEVSKTYYNASLNNTVALSGFTLSPTYLHNRVATLTTEKVDDGNDLTYDHALYYSYDIHGMAKQVLQHIPQLDRFEKGVFNLEYEYELISGKVLSVDYQKGQLDQFYHRYQYDGDNRLKAAYTSRDNIHYESDVRYDYTLHGTLGRTELGELRVQGIDYAYNLQGWIKAVNGSNLIMQEDMGRDGDGNSIQLNSNLYPNPHHYVARDAFSYYLSYHEEDYQSVSNDAIEPMLGSASTDYRSLYNGNIAMMGTSLPKGTPYGTSRQVQGEMYGNVYHYDQLNRITQHKVMTNLTGNYWSSGGLSGNPFYEDFGYDANGNIIHLNRNGGSSIPGNIVMDNLDYRYDVRNFAISINHNSSTHNFNWSQLESNKLYHVNDGVTPTNYNSDVDDQGTFTATPATINQANNYGYDELGNLVRDDAEEIASIVWNSKGKVDAITRANGSDKPDMEFGYDAVGHRMWKLIKPKVSGQLATQEQWKTTYYVYDPSGNVMANYSESYLLPDPSQAIAQLHVSSWSIYGSSRVGVQNENVLLADLTLDLEQGNEFDQQTGEFNIVSTSAPTNYLLTTNHCSLLRGCKQYELTNHLGNVLATIQDRKLGQVPSWAAKGGYLYTHYQPYISSVTDYYAFGSQIEERSWVKADEGYQYGFNGKERDKETYNDAYDFGARIYDGRLGRWLSVDAESIKGPGLSPYNYSVNAPIWIGDPDGNWIEVKTTKYRKVDGHYVKLRAISFRKADLIDKKIIVHQMKILDLTGLKRNDGELEALAKKAQEQITKAWSTTDNDGVQSVCVDNKIEEGFVSLKKDVLFRSQVEFADDIKVVKKPQDISKKDDLIVLTNDQEANNIFERFDAIGLSGTNTPLLPRGVTYIYGGWLYSSISNSNRVFAHEFGHGLGLGDDKQEKHKGSHLMYNENPDNVFMKAHISELSSIRNPTTKGISGKSVRKYQKRFEKAETKKALKNTT